MLLNPQNIRVQFVKFIFKNKHLASKVSLQLFEYLVGIETSEKDEIEIEHQEESLLIPQYNNSAQNIIQKHPKPKASRISTIHEEEVPLDRVNTRTIVEEQDSIDDQLVSFDYSNEIAYDNSTVPMTTNKNNWTQKFDKDLIFRADDSINLQRDSNLSIGNLLIKANDKRDK